MTQLDPPTASTSAHTSGEASGSTSVPPPARTTRPRIPAVLCLCAVVAVYLLAVCTPFGQRAENSLFVPAGGGGGAWMHDWSGVAYDSHPIPPLDDSAMPTLVVGCAVIAAVALVRRCRRRGCLAAGVVGLTLVGTTAGKDHLPRPDLVHADVMLVDPSFPSGHAAVPAALTLALTLVVSARVRPYVLVIGTTWFALIAGTVQAIGDHRPSDVLGSTLLACGLYGLAARLLPGDTPRVVRCPRALTAIGLVLAVAGAVVGGGRSDSLSGPLVHMVTALACVTLLWFTAENGPAPAERRTRPARG
ncbi:hypothetical protein GCM10010512_22530 [Streptomyces thermoviolaceus subsp. thermoviolaceus]|nr:hypothetical protein GCM10010512_22530 [Streptomyces thermoviolaceus subsp. thermoviolaceus]